MFKNKVEDFNGRKIASGPISVDWTHLIMPKTIDNISFYCFPIKSRKYHEINPVISNIISNNDSLLKFIRNRVPSLYYPNNSRQFLKQTIVANTQFLVKLIGIGINENDRFNSIRLFGSSCQRRIVGCHVVSFVHDFVVVSCRTTLLDISCNYGLAIDTINWRLCTTWKCAQRHFDQKRKFLPW